MLLRILLISEEESSPCSLSSLTRSGITKSRPVVFYFYFMLCLLKFKAIHMYFHWL